MQGVEELILTQYKKNNKDLYLPLLNLKFCGQNCLLGIMVVIVFIILDWIFVSMNTTAMIPCRYVLC